ncbi:DUF2130 domain-containing protein [Spiroplasma culicicola]|uniref:DUF2130 domain-containing protein n=1 Tax=Spiroplasma culicicola AES-1 TaxID=1276246 RepID=W6A785_9MOLU|nr:DUF2130 domain-containing protein [Spiroplasma culicicola]AHI52690.1 hypothetical protein SCULI_v1c03490 [Spiroplasma culicicola AES-1]
MELNFLCPKCNQVITEKDFNQNEKSLAQLKDFFQSKANAFKTKIRQELVVEFENQKETEIQLKLSQQKSAMDKIINDLEGQIKNFESIKELEIQKRANQMANEFQAQLNHLQEHKNSLEKQILNFENQIKTFELTKDQLILKSREELRQEYEQKFEIANKQILELEKSNSQFKVIQNKTKGENFEHDVEGELRKVFTEDIITKITSQTKKADYLQEVRIDNEVIGKIVYEVKNAVWSSTWEKKLVDDMARVESKYGILVATSFNDQYRGIPFKVSDYSPNIFLTDPDSFTFVGNIIRSLIKAEKRLQEKYENNQSSEKIKEFNNWKETTFNSVSKLFEEQFKRIEENENSIKNKIDDIRIAREKLYSNWTKVVKNFIEGINI